MNCLKHPKSPAAGACAGCAEPYCDLCLSPMKGAKYCSECRSTALRPATDSGPSGECEEAGTALKYAIIGIFCFGIILEPLAIAKGFKAKQMIRENPRLEGAGKATAAIVIGFIALGLWILGIIARVALAGQ